VKDQERESTIQVGLYRITPCSNRSLFQEELSRADNPNRTHRCAHREIRLDRWEGSWRWQQWKLLGWWASCLDRWPCPGPIDFFNHEQRRQV